MARFAEIAHGSPAYAVACSLRDAVLRRPLGLELEIVDTQLERGCRHFGLFEGDARPDHDEPLQASALIAVLVATPREDIAPDTAQLRQLAVAPERQGEGLGRQLMEATEAELARSGVRHLYLNARKPVIPFYTRLGYRTVGPPHVEIGIAHQRMEKELAYSV